MAPPRESARKPERCGWARIESDRLSEKQILHDNREVSMNEYTIKDKVAIVGLGETKYYRRGQAPVSEFRLACEAIIKAANDAGIDVRDIDGISDTPTTVTKRRAS